MKVVTAKRNEPCPCGSGKKFKSCCATKRASTVVTSRRSQVPVYVMALALVGGAIAGIRAVTRAPEAPPPAFVPPQPATRTATRPLAPASAPQPDPVTGLYPHPPGPAPEGRVWSPEHGHWHNLPTLATPQTRQVEVPSTPPFTGRPTPPYNRRVAQRLQETLRTYDLPVSADLQAVLPPPTF